MSNKENLKFNFKIKKRCWSNCIGRAATQLPLPGAIPLLLNTGTFGCLVSHLARFAPP